MVTKLPWQPKLYFCYSIVWNHTEFILGIKIPWDNRHQLHTSLLQQLSYHGNYSDFLITPLSLDMLSSYLAWDSLETLSNSQIIRCCSNWVTIAMTMILQLLFCLKLYWIHVWYGASLGLLSCNIFCGPTGVFLSKSGRFTVSIWLEKKDFLRYHFGYHDNLVTMAMRYVTNVCCLQKDLPQIWNQ